MGTGIELNFGGMRKRVTNLHERLAQVEAMAAKRGCPCQHLQRQLEEWDQYCGQVEREMAAFVDSFSS